jgi:hypothetical protein
MSNLLRDAKFWTAVLDTVISIALFFTGKYLAPEVAEDVKFLVAALQPIFLALIAALFAFEREQLRVGVHPLQLKK